MPGQSSVAFADRDAPVEVAGDAAVLEPVAVVQPLLRDGRGEHRPVGFAVDPVVELPAHPRLLQEQVLGLAHLKIGRAADRRARIDEVGRVELLGAVFALVAAGAVIAAIGAGALDVAVGQEAAVGFRIDLFFRDFLDQPGVGQPAGEMLGEPVVLGRRGAAEMVERQPEPGGEPGLDLVHARAIRGHRLAGFGRGQFRRGAVLVGGADEHHLMAPRALVAGVEIGRKLGADEVTEVLDTVDVGQRGGDENAGHGMSFGSSRRDLAYGAGHGQRMRGRSAAPVGPGRAARRPRVPGKDSRARARPVAQAVHGGAGREPGGHRRIGHEASPEAATPPRAPDPAGWALPRATAVSRGFTRQGPRQLGWAPGRVIIANVRWRWPLERVSSGRQQEVQIVGRGGQGGARPLERRFEAPWSGLDPVVSTGIGTDPARGGHLWDDGAGRPISATTVPREDLDRIRQQPGEAVGGPHRPRAGRHGAQTVFGGVGLRGGEGLEMAEIPLTPPNLGRPIHAVCFGQARGAAAGLRCWQSMSLRVTPFRLVARRRSAAALARPEARGPGPSRRAGASVTSCRARSSSSASLAVSGLRRVNLGETRITGTPKRPSTAQRCMTAWGGAGSGRRDRPEAGCRRECRGGA